MKTAKLLSLIEEFSVDAGLRNIGVDNKFCKEVLESDDFDMGHYYAYSLLTRFVRKAMRQGVLQIAGGPGEYQERTKSSKDYKSIAETTYTETPVRRTKH